MIPKAVLMALLTVLPAAQPIDGKAFDERAAAFIAYCAKERPRREDYPKEAMAYFLYRLIRDTGDPQQRPPVGRRLSAPLQSG